MAYTEDFGDNDITNLRTIDVESNIVNVKRLDPYGFWKCSLNRGAIAPELSGQYTSFYEAERAVIAYYSGKGKEAKEIVK